MFALFAAMELGRDPRSNECGLADTGGATCPVDGCAETCTSLSEGRSCCIGAHGRGLSGPSLTTMERICPSCDPSHYLTEGAALCIGQVHGLPSGALGCDVFLSDLGTSGVWEAWNGTQSCEENGTWIADVVMVDATTGGFYSFGAVIADCDL